MLARVVVENGVKKLVPLTADAGAGNPVGSLLHTYKKSNPSGYLYCDGRDTTGTSEELSTHYPLLYAYLGSNILPDFRECVEVGAEQNTTDTIATHDVYTEGQFKDDQLQDYFTGGNLPTYIGGEAVVAGLQTGDSNYYVGNQRRELKATRRGTTTHGKQKAVFVYIKATSGLSENAQDNVVAQLNEERSYSTEEHWTGKYWHNGKKIYEKTITGLSLSGVKTDWTNMGITIANLDEITNATTYRLNPNGIISGNSYLVSSGGAIAYLSSTGQSVAKISFEYTKTTD